jgi:hypothetical protein
MTLHVNIQSEEAASEEEPPKVLLKFLRLKETGKDQAVAVSVKTPPDVYARADAGGDSYRG